MCSWMTEFLGSLSAAAVSGASAGRACPGGRRPSPGCRGRRVVGLEVEGATDQRDRLVQTLSALGQHCKTKVELVKNGTALKCGQCKRVYPIKDDIPVMLLDEATIEP